MDLILWRHAEAQPGENGLADSKRRLTKNGDRQAHEMAKWLRPHFPKKLKILVSPAERAQQTAHALAMPFDIEKRLAVGADTADLLAACGWPEQSGAVLLVSHQPALGRLASLLIGGQESDWVIKKGAVWWLSRRSREGRDQLILRAVMNPDMLH
jgi:phosphohistidine phosphatase